MNPAPPPPDELVEMLFSEILQPPEGYEYYPNNIGEQLLYPVYGSDRWRILLHKKGTPVENPENFTPIFLEGQFVSKVAKALHSMQREMNQAVSDDIPEPTGGVIQ